MYIIYYDGRQTTVAPVRERGLKLPPTKESETERKGRSRKGAWIEISVRAEFDNDPRKSLP